MLWLTTTIVSMVAWADRRSGGRAVSSNTALPPPPAGGVDTQPGDGQQRVGLGDHAPVPFPAPEALLAERVARAGSWIASRKQQQRHAQPSRDDVTRKRRAKACTGCRVHWDSILPSGMVLRACEPRL